MKCVSRRSILFAVSIFVNVVAIQVSLVLMIILHLLLLPQMHNIVYRVLPDGVSITIEKTKSYSLISKGTENQGSSTSTYDSYCRSTQPG
jgi:hypothetical protein